MARKKLANICIDPGHGGKASGAVNSELNIMEKDIALAVSFKVSEYLLYATKSPVTGELQINSFCQDNHTPLVNVFMTRGMDVDVSLQDRCEIANKIKASCFVSIHCNSYSGTVASGIETWMYKGCSKASKTLAQRIHRSIMESVKGFEVTDEDGTKHSPISRGVKENQTYYTLRHTSMPSVVVEIGFLSHHGEATLLNSEEYQDAIAKGIAYGILYSYA